MTASRAQAMLALDFANEIRSQRADLKRQIRAGEVTVIEVLGAVPAYAKTMPIATLLRAQKGWERIRVRKFCAQLLLPETRELGCLTPGQIERIMAELDRLAHGNWHNRKGKR